MELADIKKSLSECSDEELRAMLSGIRTSRRTAKPRAEVQVKRTTTPKAKTEVSVETLTNNMSKEQILQLLAAMGGK